MRTGWLIGAALALVVAVSGPSGGRTAVAGAMLSDPVTVPDTRSPSLGPRNGAPAAAPIELAILDLTNDDRARQGLSRVELDPETIEIARSRASVQLAEPSLSHYDQSGELAFARLMAEAHVGYRLAGENLARLSGGETPDLPTRVQRAFMQSPTHRQVILEPSFNRLAVGWATDSDGRMAFAQIFRTAP